MDFRMQVQEQGDQKMVNPGSVDRTDIKNIEAGNISNENAERRANTPISEQSFTSIQAFDGVGEHPCCVRMAVVYLSDKSLLKIRVDSINWLYTQYDHVLARHMGD